MLLSDLPRDQISTLLHARMPIWWLRSLGSLPWFPSVPTNPFATYEYSGLLSDLKGFAHIIDCTLNNSMTTVLVFLAPTLKQVVGRTEGDACHVGPWHGRQGPLLLQQAETGGLHEWTLNCRTDFCGVPLTCVPITSSALTTTVHNLASIHPVTKQPDVGIHSTLTSQPAVFPV